MNESFTRLLDGLLPPEVGDELRRNIDAALQGYLERMNLATREQLEIQEKILRRTRERITELERRIAELEAAHAESPIDNPANNPAVDESDE